VGFAKGGCVSESRGGGGEVDKKGGGGGGVGHTQKERLVWVAVHETLDGRVGFLVERVEG
jgi:hypothetical protein